MCRPKMYFQEGVTGTFAEIMESLECQEEYLKQRPMTFTNDPLSHPVLLLQSPSKDPTPDYLRQKESHLLR